MQPQVEKSSANAAVNSLDVKSRLGITSQPVPTSDAPFSKRNSKNG
jgi:hypothetical protein